MAQLQPIKVRTLIQALTEAGCEPVRVTGSHGIYKTPKSGRSFSIVVNHLNREVSLVVLSNVRRVLKGDGIDLFDVLAKKMREAPTAPEPPAQKPAEPRAPRGPYNFRTPEEKIGLLRRILELRAAGKINPEHVMERDTGIGRAQFARWRRQLDEAGYRVTLEHPLPPEAYAVLDGKQGIRDGTKRAVERRAAEGPTPELLPPPPPLPVPPPSNGELSLDGKRAVLAELGRAKHDLSVLARLARDHEGLTVGALARWRDEVDAADCAALEVELDMGSGTVEDRLVRLEATVARLVRSLGGL